MKRKGAVSPVGAGIASMTGFGKGEISTPSGLVSVELRSVNNRFCDIGMRLPRELNGLEAEIRERIRNSVQRGKISMLIAIKREAGQAAPLQIDFQAAQTCFTKLQELNRQLGQDGSATLGQLLHFSDYFALSNEETIDEETRERIFLAIETALTDLRKMRRSEGEVLARDLLSHQARIEEYLEKIEALAADQPQQQMQKLRERLELLASSAALDPGRLETEMALMADRLDISEECVRLRSHALHLRQAIAGDEAPGKKLGFLLQEMQREVNTIGSKSALPEISHLTVQMKEEIERMREQIQNLE